MVTPQQPGFIDSVKIELYSGPRSTYAITYALSTACFQEKPVTQ